MRAAQARRLDQRLQAVDVAGALDRLADRAQARVLGGRVVDADRRALTRRGADHVRAHRHLGARARRRIATARDGEEPVEQQQHRVVEAEGLVDRGERLVEPRVEVGGRGDAQRRAPQPGEGARAAGRHRHRGIAVRDPPDGLDAVGVGAAQPEHPGHAVRRRDAGELGLDRLEERALGLGAQVVQLEPVDRGRVRVHRQRLGPRGGEDVGAGLGEGLEGQADVVWIDVLDLREVGDVRRALARAGGHRREDRALEALADRIERNRRGVGRGRGAHASPFSDVPARGRGVASQPSSGVKATPSAPSSRPSSSTGEGRRIADALQVRGQRVAAGERERAVARLERHDPRVAALQLHRAVPARLAEAHRDAAVRGNLLEHEAALAARHEQHDPTAVVAGADGRTVCGRSRSSRVPMPMLTPPATNAHRPSSSSEPRAARCGGIISDRAKRSTMVASRERRRKGARSVEARCGRAAARRPGGKPVPRGPRTVSTPELYAARAKRARYAAGGTPTSRRNAARKVSGDA